MYIQSKYKKLLFEEIKLNFIEENLTNIFANKNNKTLAETIKHKRYEKFKYEIEKHI